MPPKFPAYIPMVRGMRVAEKVTSATGVRILLLEYISCLDMPSCWLDAWWGMGRLTIWIWCARGSPIPSRGFAARTPEAG